MATNIKQDYSIELRMDGDNKGFRNLEYFGQDGLTEEECLSLLAGYLTYSGTVRVYAGMQMIFQRTTKQHELMK